jgi:hypothetical protein
LCFFPNICTICFKYICKKCDWYLKWLRKSLTFKSQFELGGTIWHWKVFGDQMVVKISIVLGTIKSPIKYSGFSLKTWLTPTCDYQRTSGGDALYDRGVGVARWPKSAANNSTVIWSWQQTNHLRNWFLSSWAPQGIGNTTPASPPVTMVQRISIPSGPGRPALSLALLILLGKTLVLGAREICV